MIDHNIRRGTVHLWPKKPVKTLKTLRVKFKKGETFLTANNFPLCNADLFDKTVILHGKGFRLYM